MARRPRSVRAGYVYHVVQRGHNGQTVFGDDQDRRLMKQLLVNHAKQFGVQVHAYVFMDNHLHLLLTPLSDPALAQLIQAVGRQYVRNFNLRWGQKGTLWQSRYYSHLIASDAHLLACMRYIDLNPVRAGLVERPDWFQWSSFLGLAGAVADPLLTPHACWWALGNTPFDREAAYQAFVAAGTQPVERQILHSAPRTGRTWAPTDTTDPILQTAPARPRGRPKKQDPSPFN